MFKKIVILIAIVIATSCSTEKREIDNFVANTLTKDEAKKWFDENSGYRVKLSSREKRNRFDNLKPLWDAAKEGRAKNGEPYVEIPLTYTTNVQVLYKIGGKIPGKDSTTLSLLPDLKLVIYERNGKKKENIKEIRFDADYLTKSRNGQQVKGFTGRIFLWSWTDELVGGEVYQNGERTRVIKPLANNSGARTSTTCMEYVDCTWSASCQEGTETWDPYWGWGAPPVAISTSTSNQGRNCLFPMYPPSYSGSCTAWELTGTYGRQECWPDGDSGGDTGSGGEPVDSFTGFPNNPLNGQKFTYTNPSGYATTFTYNQRFKAWMLPEVSSLAQRGGTFSMNSTTIFPGQVLSAIAVPALAEPTPVGEIVLAAATVVYAGIYIFDQIAYINYLRGQTTREHCILMFTRCVTNKPNLPCSTCLQYCNTQGEWDFVNCPNIAQP
nr:hypothetical protein [uncultured Dyadobacter sp.]